MTVSCTCEPGWAALLLPYLAVVGVMGIALLIIFLLVAGTKEGP